MTRRFYRFLLWMHPPAFRCRFGDEMLSIFDEEGSPRGCFALLLDGLRSFARQWLLRTDSWKILIAIGGAFIQVWGFGYRFGYRIEGQQNWTENHRALSPYMPEMILITLILVCSLFITIVSLALWTVRFQRGRSQGRGLHFCLARHCHACARLPARKPQCSKFAS